jgi:hypothetical protein
VTLAEWNALRVGDRIVDNHHRRAVRKIKKITRVSGKPTQRGLTRTALVTKSLKSRKGYTVIFESENTGPSRFDLAVKL